MKKAMRLAIPLTLDKKLVTLAIFVAVIGIGITIALSFHYSNIILEERIMDQLLSESTIRGDSIRSLFNSKLQQIQVIGTDPMIRNLIGDLNVVDNEYVLTERIAEKRIDFLIQIQAFETTIGGSNELENVEIIGKSGRELFSLINTKNKNSFLADQKFVRGVKEPFAEIILGKDNKRKLVTVTPIFANPKDKETIGVAIVTANTQSIDQILLNRFGLGNTGEAYLVNKNKMMVTESRFTENAPFHQVVNTDAVSECFDNKKNFHGQYTDYRQVFILGSSSCMDDLGLVLLVEIDDNEVFQPVKNLQEKVIMLGVIMTIIVGTAAFFLSKLISRPIIKLRNAANKIADGNFDVRTNIATRDEIGDLSHSFDMMAEKIQDSLIKIREREDIIKQQKDILLQFSEYSSNYCVCFVDIVGSTKITAKLSDLETSKFYSIFLNSMATIVTKYGGIVVKNIGDALLYYFPKTDTDDMGPFENMLRCSVDMLESRSKINERLTVEKLPEVSYRISAAFGPVRVAIVATSTIDDIFGTTVNKCAKINTLATPNTLVVDESLYNKIKGIGGYEFDKIADYNIDADNNFSVYFVKQKTG
ncbi:MAG: adenylate/guanylate cyclase domain-containing protein [Candidatus Nitrosotenuis sp.]|nr:MAG: adenylate/guanylate cyclase domain-containing protein [Candidatus Nitrosotenuis sp.]